MNATIPTTETATCPDVSLDDIVVMALTPRDAETVAAYQWLGLGALEILKKGWE